MKISIYILMITIFFFCCNSPYKIKDDEIRYLDLKLDSCIYRNLGIKELKLVISSDYKFHFEPSTDFLKDFEGKWYVEVNIDGLGNEIFKCNNGQKFENWTWYNVEINGVTCDFYFVPDTSKKLN